MAMPCIACAHGTVPHYLSRTRSPRLRAQIYIGLRVWQICEQEPTACLPKLTSACRNPAGHSPADA